MTASGAGPAPAGRGEWAIACLVVAAVAVLATWPLAVSPWLVPAHQDPLFSAWRLYQWTRNLAAGAPDGLFGGNIFHPAGDVLLYSDAIPLPALLGAPFIAAGVPVTIVYTALVWASYLTAGLAMFACAREISGSRWGGLVAAAIFIGAPARLDHVMHLELLWTAWMPLAVLGTARVLRGRGRAVWLIGGSLAAQFLCCIYYGVFLFTIWPLLAGVEWLRARPELGRATVRRGAVALGLAALVAGVYALPYQRARQVVGEREDYEVLRYSATLESYAVSPPSSRWWGWTFGDDDAELRLFPGLLGTSLAVTALATPAAPWTAALAVTTAFAMEASTGLNGVTYPLLRRLAPPYRGLRVPARFGAVALMGVALLAALGCANLTRACGQVPGAPVAAVMALAFIAAESAAALPVRVLPRAAPPVYALLADLPPTVIVHTPLPFPEALPGPEADFQYFAQYHQHELINGNSGFYPPNYLKTLDRARRFPDDRALAALREAGAEYLLVHEQFFPTREAFAQAAVAMEGRDDVTPVATSSDDGGAVLVYRLGARSASRRQRLRPIGNAVSRSPAGRGITCTPTSSPTRRAAAAPASVAAFTEPTSPRTMAVTSPASTFCQPTNTTLAVFSMASAASTMPT